MSWENNKNKTERLRKQQDNDETKNSADKLSRDIESRVKTILIGALDSFEKQFGQLWNHGGKPTSESEQFFKDKYLETRKEILDKGNDQKRLLIKELDNYVIKVRQYYVYMPVVNSIDEFKKLKEKQCKN